MRTSDGLRARYFSNRFLDLLRLEMRVDEKEWQSLISVLADLAKEWRATDRVDKDLVQDLFVLPGIIRGAAFSLQSHQAALSKDLDDRATELEALILEALA